MTNVVILGDSIMRGVMPDENGKYVIKGERIYKEVAERYDLTLTNCSAFGLTAKKALEKRLHIKCLTTKSGKCEVLLIALGGNDCDYDWQKISDAPEDKHFPVQTVNDFMACLTQIIDEVRAQNVVPILSVPLPIDAEKYFIKSCEGRNAENVKKWLNGDVTYIYRWQESYAFAVTEVARKTNVELVDARSAFLSDKNFGSYISSDGIHLNENGQAALAAYYNRFIEERRK